MKTLQTKRRVGVRFKTSICDADGKIERVLNEDHNLITDWGMDALAATRLGSLLSHLHLGSTTQVLKRLLPGGETVDVDITDPANITIQSTVNFFESDDVNRSIKLGSGAMYELKIHTFTDAQNVIATTRGGTFSPVEAPAGGTYSDVGIHYTNGATIGSQFQKFNTYDTAEVDYNHELSDYVNNGFTQKRIWLSAVVTGSPWTVNMLGWSDGNGSNNCFGKANLASPDVVAVGKRYRVELTVDDNYGDYIDLSGETMDFGGTIGSYEVDVRQERIGFDASAFFSFTRPLGSANLRAQWVTSASPVMQATRFEGDPSFGAISRTRTVQSTSGAVADGAYTAGHFKRTREITWGDSVNIVNATALEVAANNNASTPILTIIPNTPFNKASGYAAKVAWTFHWTRDLFN